jgi:undecaprenyl diphosphate synthase
VSLDKNNIPKHVAIIMDGNGRWAKKQGKPRVYGHQKGVDSVKKAVEYAGEIGIEYLTLYAFSTENWNRPQEEVNALMQLLVSTLNGQIESLNKNNVKLLTIGDIESLPAECIEELNEAKETTAKNTGLNLVLALSYSAKWEIIEATKKIACKVKNNELNIEDINDKIISNHLSTKGIPDPELLIRTSGEMRISNFLLWQLAYAELYFTQKLWPEFDKQDFEQAIIDYQNRERRFGMISEQINK